MSYLVSLNSSLKQLAKNAGAVLYLDARKANGNGLPINSPLTNPWTDLSGQGNNATPTNMAGTSASGVDTTDPLKPFWALDGSDDFFSLVNTASVDITSSPLAVFSTVRIRNAVDGYILCKNASLSTDVQYGLNFQNSTSAIRAYLEGTGRSTSGAVSKDTWLNVGFIWDGTNVKYYVNGAASGTPGSYSGTLTSRANIRIGRRENATVYFKGDIATASIYADAKATEANILKAEKAISKAYVGG